MDVLYNVSTRKIPIKDAAEEKTCKMLLHHPVLNHMFSVGTPLVSSCRPRHPLPPELLE